MNSIAIIGTVARDIEFTTTKNGIALATFSVVVKRTKEKNQADFFEITCWRGMADIVKTLKKHAKVYIRGQMQQSVYVDNSGIKRSTWHIIVDEIEFLSPKNGIKYKKSGKEKIEETEETDEDNLITIPDDMIQF